ncbi:MAG: Rieske (2Fe-2S) protein [Gammaproteobacteria bacterium]|nr:Rieske (2Fe-2S) protein [Gammaproteobacteria bacterium]
MNSVGPDPWPEWPICRLDELTDPDARGFYVGEEEWPFRGFIVRKGQSIFAYANICPHRRHPLDFLPDAFLVEDGKLIRCASHGALFDPENGLCVFGPCQGDSLLQLATRLDGTGTILVSAPASLREVGPISGSAINGPSASDSDIN